MVTHEPLFKDISGCDVEQQPTVVESLCPSCFKNGQTTIFLTKIPHYREIILMSFKCESCGHSNNEIQSGGKVQERGVTFRLTVSNIETLGRQIVKCDSAFIKIPEVELEIPKESQKGIITTVEGILRRTIDGLNQDQAVRKDMEPEAHAKIEKYVIKLEKLIDSVSETNPFVLILSDPSGNSFIENPNFPKEDPSLKVSHFTRTKEQDHELCIYNQDELAVDGEKTNETDSKEIDIQNEVLQFPTNCPDCNAPAKTNMKMTNIPFFKEVVIMATVCESCGHKTNEVKSGGGIEPFGTKITLHVTDPQSDFNRDVLKSETCRIEIPDLELDVGGFSIGGRFTTLEGLLNNISDELSNNPFTSDSSDTCLSRDKMKAFLKQLESFKLGEVEDFTVIFDDPAGNSYVQNLYAPDPDPELKVEEYDRTFEQNEMLGLNDMKTENYHHE